MERIQSFDAETIERCIQMGWEDRTPWEAIQKQFSLSPNEFVKLMRHFLPRDRFERWRRRISEQGRLKNQKQRGFLESRFKCTRQSVDGTTKGWK